MLILITVPISAMATNGYFAHGYGTKNKGLAGSGVALPQDTMIAATNPAGMVWVGKRFDLGAAIFSPNDRSYTATMAAAGPAANGNGTRVLSDDAVFLIPHFGFNWMINEKSSIGVTVYGNGGMNTDYDAGDTPGGLGTFGGPPTGFTGDAGVDLIQLFISTTYARKVGENGSWGVSAILAYQLFEAKGLANFGGISNDAANLTNNGKDSSTGIGFKFGYQHKIGPVTLAASYQSKIDMSEFDDYAGLFVDKGDFDIPSTWTVGAAMKLGSKSTLTFDIQRINYTDVDAISNPFTAAGLAACGGGATASCLGGKNGIGFGWEDMTIYKLGFQLQQSDKWTWRFGYSKGDQPIPKSEVLFNILAPAVIEEHYTFGFTRIMGKEKNSELNFAFMYAPNNSVTGTPFSGGGQTVKIEMEQYEFELSWSKRY